jgi:hypothetical protein
VTYIHAKKIFATIPVKHRGEQADPDHSRVVGREEARQSSQKHRPFDPDVQHAASLGECFAERRQQHGPRKAQAGR